MICPSVIYYRLCRTPAISNYFSLPRPRFGIAALNRSSKNPSESLGERGMLLEDAASKQQEPETRTNRTVIELRNQISMFLFCFHFLL